MIGSIGDPASDAYNYDLQSLRGGVEKMRENVAIFRESIANEEKQIAYYEQMIAVLEADQRRAGVQPREV